MSRDIKYIGMDVHQQAIVIAVLNESGKLVMETILETKASSILQFTGRAACKLGRRHLGGLAFRSAAAAGATRCGL
jgi:hypothetical protein